MFDLEFQLKPSVYYISLMCGLLISALLILLFLPFLHLLLKIFALLVTLLYGRFILKRYGLLSDVKSIIAIRKLADDRWLLYTQKQCEEATLLGDSTVSRFISILLFRVNKSYLPKVCVILPDSLMDNDDYRKLVVMLKLQQM